MNMLANLTTDESIQDETDRLRGGAGPLESDAYLMTVEAAYLDTASSGALALQVILKAKDDRRLRDTFWMTSGTAKGGKNYFERDGRKFYLPGFLQANALARLTVGKEIGELKTEPKIIKLWNRDVGQEIPTEVEMFMDLLGQQIMVGVQRQTQDRRIQAASGEWVNSGETIDVSVVDKLFRATDNKTVAEIMSQEEATFLDKWLASNRGKTRNRAKGASGTSTPAAKAPATSKSLFG